MLELVLNLAAAAVAADTGIDMADCTFLSFVFALDSGLARAPETDRA